MVFSRTVSINKAIFCRNVYGNETIFYRNVYKKNTFLMQSLNECIELKCDSYFHVVCSRKVYINKAIFCRTVYRNEMVFSRAVYIKRYFVLLYSYKYQG